eukprot:1149004-Pelagomonas_calceolata.AAC.2
MGSLLTFLSNLFALGISLAKPRSQVGAVSEQECSSRGPSGCKSGLWCGTVLIPVDLTLFPAGGFLEKFCLQVIQVALLSGFQVHFKDDECWTAQLIQAFQGLRSSEIFEQAVRSGNAIFLNDFSADLGYKLQGAWREAGSMDPRGNNNQFATYQGWPLLLHKPLAKPTYPCLGIFFWICLLGSKQVMRNMSRFWLHAHTLTVESAIWQDGTSVCDRRSCSQTQDEAHVFSYCTD